VAQWKEAFGWYLDWLKFAQATGTELRTLEERMGIMCIRALARMRCKEQ
jgi:hypothetical protein